MQEDGIPLSSASPESKWWVGVGIERERERLDWLKRGT
jgi:hypothetical protein